MHRAIVDLLPAVQVAACKAPALVKRAGVLLLVGNWHRAENRDGANAFFEALAGVGSEANRDCRIERFIVAGVGADSMVARLDRSTVGGRSPKIDAVSDYADLDHFDACALVAPILLGAGIKIKTLEAWRSAIPVLGTAQAFTGLAPAVWTQGGLRFHTLEDLAAYCCSDFTHDSRFLALNPAGAMDAYLSQTGAIRSPPRDAAEARV